MVTATRTTTTSDSGRVRYQTRSIASLYVEPEVSTTRFVCKNAGRSAREVRNLLTVMDGGDEHRQTDTGEREISVSMRAANTRNLDISFERRLYSEPQRNMIHE